MPVGTAVPPTQASSRYELLDGWRGIAALSVLGYHSINSLVTPDRSWVAAILWHGWAGVYLFFPISGYCILAASCSRRNAGTWEFLKRRWRRIFPAYWASIVVAVAAFVVFAPISPGGIDVLRAPGAAWIAIVTLTQGLAGIPDAVNPVYWSLCYEEQFYLVLAVSLLLGVPHRRWLLIAVSIASCAAALPAVAHVLPTGLFLQYWLNFAVGLAVFGWFDPRFGKPWSTLHLAMAAAVALATARLDLTLSLAFAVGLIVLRPFDVSLSASAPARWLAAAGLFSYSLYLTHVPVAGRVVNLARRFGAADAWWWPAVVVAAVVTALAFAWAFFQLVERRFTSVQPRLDPALDRQLAAALEA